MVAGIELVSRQTLLTEDTAIGLLFVGMLALGVVIISSVSSYTGSLTSILFGDALGVTHEDLVQQAALGLVVVLVSALMYRPFLALAFNRQKAELLGMRPARAHAVLLVLIAAAVIGSFQSIGTLLVFGLLVGPPATAALVVRTVPRMMAIAATLSVASVWIGLLLSYHLGTAGSATMALVPIVAFFVTLAWTRWRSARASQRDADVPRPPGDELRSHRRRRPGRARAAARRGDRPRAPLRQSHCAGAVQLHDPSGRRHRCHRTERLGQVDAAACPGRPGTSRRRELGRPGDRPPARAR
jgi:ABC-type Mn2+/Zn2+ transport system permease subunit